MSDRDTKFAGFASLLLRELDEAIGRIAEELDAKRGELDDSLLEGEVARELGTIIARRAYDLAYFLVESAYQHRGTFAGEIRQSVSMLPDMNAWPEDK